VHEAEGFTRMSQGLDRVPQAGATKVGWRRWLAM
jgi:hypothetical protein